MQTSIGGWNEADDEQKLRQRLTLASPTITRHCASPYAYLCDNMSQFP